MNTEPDDQTQEEPDSYCIDPEPGQFLDDYGDPDYEYEKQVSIEIFGI